jgi:hypothetical protein
VRHPADQPDVPAFHHVDPFGDQHEPMLPSARDGITA